MRPFWKSAIMQRLQPIRFFHQSHNTVLFGGLFTLKQWIIGSLKHDTVPRVNKLYCFYVKNPPKRIALWDREKSQCTILTLGQKLKFQKTCQNQFSKSLVVVLCKKTAPKNTKYSRNETILKIGHHAKAIAHAKSLLWVKN